MCTRPRERQPEDRHLTPRVAVILGPIKTDTECREREMEVSICTIVLLQRPLDPATGSAPSRSLLRGIQT